MGKLLKNAINRVSSIDFQAIRENMCESNHTLVSEYFRRVNVFLDDFSATVDKYPIFSVANVLGKTVHVDIFKACPELEAINNLYIKVLCYCYLEISVLADEGVPEALEYVDMYEPMIKLFERGGGFSIRQGEMIIGTSAYPLNYWRVLPIPLKDISDATLDSVDKD